MNTNRYHVVSGVPHGRIPDGGLRMLGPDQLGDQQDLRPHHPGTAGAPVRHAWSAQAAVLGVVRVRYRAVGGQVAEARHRAGDTAGGTPRGCEYELQQHRRLAERHGVAPEVQEKIFDWPHSEGLSTRRQVLLNATDEFVTKRTIGGGTWEALSRHLQPRQLIEFCMLAGQYDALAATIAALEIPLDFPTDAAS